MAIVILIKLTAGDSNQVAEQQTTKVVLPPEQDLLTAMGRVYERDMYHLGEQLKQKGVRLDDHPKMAPVETDPNLTAEQVFYPNAKDPQVNYLYDPSDKGPPMNARKLSDSETLRLWGLLRIHSMASLVLYKQRCGYLSSTELLLIEDQFGKLPENYRVKALEHEIKAIEARPPFDNNKDQIHVPGGWQWFCGLVHDSIADYDYDHMFKTAVEMK